MCSLTKLFFSSKMFCSTWKLLCSFMKVLREKLCIWVQNILRLCAKLLMEIILDRRNNYISVLLQVVVLHDKNTIAVQKINKLYTFLCVCQCSWARSRIWSLKLFWALRSTSPQPARCLSLIAATASVRQNHIHGLWCYVSVLFFMLL